MSGKTLMVLGTASHVGKSVLVTALCRILRQDGFRVAPFKAQNMSNNSYVTADGGEIGRAQAVQAEAAGVDPTVDMNPILLKPEADSRSQVVVLGKSVGTTSARDYYAMKSKLWETVTHSLDALRSRYDVVVIEGAGSPVELNLKQSDIVNMRVAQYANSPVLLVADIDRGGIFASLLGTVSLLEPDERALVKGLVVNKFRGDPTLFAPGIATLQERTGIPVAGVLPYIKDINVPQEDSVPLEDIRSVIKKPVLDIAVVKLPHISNFDDFEPLDREPDVTLRYVNARAALGKPDLIIIPGTKTTMADLSWMQDNGLADSVRTLASQGVPVVGICGGYQMLGRHIVDPLRVESRVTEARGLGLLDVRTIFEQSKETHRVKGHVTAARGLFAYAKDVPVQGYEIHMGRTIGEGAAPVIRITERSGSAMDAPDGALGLGGSVFGTYVHGLFHNTALRRAILQALAERKGVALSAATPQATRDEAYDRLADVVRANLDMRLVYSAIGPEPARG